jgi:hypothetical protein
VAGIGLLNKTLVLFFAAGVMFGILLAGPRGALRNRWVLLGGRWPWGTCSAPLVPVWLAGLCGCSAIPRFGVYGRSAGPTW